MYAGEGDSSKLAYSKADYYICLGVSGSVRNKSPTSVQRVKSVLPCENSVIMFRKEKKKKTIQASGVRGATQFGADEQLVIVPLLLSLGRCFAMICEPKNTYALALFGLSHKHRLGR